MINLSDRIVTLLEANDIWVSWEQAYDGGNEMLAEMEFYTPAGEDFCFAIWYDGSETDFSSAFRQYVEEFDPDEHACLWINCRGRHGVPSSIREIIDDAEWILAKLSQIATALDVLLQEV